MRPDASTPQPPASSLVRAGRTPGLALGRGNYLFVGTENGGKSLATLYSVVATCEQHGINPQTYLEAVLAETITKESGAAWTPKAWLDRVTSDTGADPPPDGNGPPTASNHDA